MEGDSIIDQNWQQFFEDAWGKIDEAIDAVEREFSDYEETMRGGKFDAQKFIKHVLKAAKGEGIVKILRFYTLMGPNWSKGIARLNKLAKRDPKIAESAQRYLRMIERISVGLEIKNYNATLTKETGITQTTVTMGRMFSCFSVVLLQLDSKKSLCKRAWSSSINYDVFCMPNILIPLFRYLELTKFRKGSRDLDIILLEDYIKVIDYGATIAEASTSKKVDKNLEEFDLTVMKKDEIVRLWDAKNAEYLNAIIGGLPLLYPNKKTLLAKLAKTRFMIREKSSLLTFDRQYTSFIDSLPENMDPIEPKLYYTPN